MLESDFRAKCNERQIRDIRKVINMDQLEEGSLSSLSIRIPVDRTIEDQCGRLQALQDRIEQCQDRAALADMYSAMTGILEELQQFADLPEVIFFAANNDPGKIDL